VFKNGALWGTNHLWWTPVNNKMDPELTAQPTYYNSTYRHGVDEKRRVQVPAKWRPLQEGFEFTVVPWPGTQEGPCLRVLPPEQMAKLTRDLAAMPGTDPKKAALKRLIGGRSEQVTVDKAGRIVLPEEMAREAGIAHDAVLVGMLDRFEIWSPERYERVRLADAMMAQEALRLME
jgi:MraZ protein